MSRIEALAELYGRHIALPWQRTIAGAQRVIIVVYEKELERSFRARKGEFEQRTRAVGYGWVEFDCTPLFAQWMAQLKYREAYFERPNDLASKLEAEFEPYVANLLRQRLHDCDETTVLAMTGVASLYGFARVSTLVRMVEPDIKGRLVIFFPGSKEGMIYRLLDARDGWNYLAQCITLHGVGGTL